MSPAAATSDEIITCARALIVGTLDSIPIAAGGEALHLVICNAIVTALPAKQ